MGIPRGLICPDLDGGSAVFLRFFVQRYWKCDLTGLTKFGGLVPGQWSMPISSSVVVSLWNCDVAVTCIAKPISVVLIPTPWAYLEV